MPTFGAACRVEIRTLGGNPVFIAAAIGRGRTTTLRPLQHRPGGRNRVGSRRVASPTSSVCHLAAERFLNITPRDDDNPDPYAAG